tara:strand:- start:194 stop:856 length:663 start_codon:yes stop_codon:yes gene_type:complete
MRRQIKTINRLRPKFVVGIGTFGAEVRKIITKTSETISLIMVEGKDFFTFWVGGAQNIVIVGDLMINPQNDLERAQKQMDFIAQELEQSKMCQHHTYVYTEIDPRLLGEEFKAKCLASRVSGIIGVSANGGGASTDFLYSKEKEKEEENEEDGDEEDKKPKIEDQSDSDSDSDDSGIDMAAEDDSVRIICGYNDKANDKLLTFELHEEMQFNVCHHDLLA